MSQPQHMTSAQVGAQGELGAGTAGYPGGDVGALMSDPKLSDLNTLLGLSPSIKFIPSLSFDCQGSPVQPGKALTQSGTSSQPSLSWHPLAASGGQVPKHLLSQVRVHGAKPGEEGSGQDKRMLVLMFDPDAPSPQNPTKRSWVHWMVADCFHGEVSNGKPVVYYAGPSPPQGEHRYITLVAEQDPAIGDLHITMPPTGIQRGGFDVAAFLKRYKLNPVGLHYFTVTAGQ